MEQFNKKLINAIQVKKYNLQQEHCSGCRSGFVNQLGHPCLFQTPEDMMELFFKNAFEMMDSSLSNQFLFSCLQSELIRRTEKKKQSNSETGNSAIIVKDDDDEEDVNYDNLLLTLVGWIVLFC